MNGMREKPGYSTEDLKQMSVGDLRGRVGRISNQQARHITVKLWQAIDENYRRKSDYVESRRNFPQDWLSFNMEPHADEMLADRLEELRGVEFGKLIALGPEQLLEFTSGLSPMLKLFDYRQRPKMTMDTAEFLLRYMECLVDPDCKVSWGARYGMYQAGSMLSIVLGIGLHGLVLFLAEQQVHSYAVPLTEVVAMLFLGAAAILGFLNREVRTKDKLRQMALYISFTDEFMDNERQYDDPALKDSGW